MTLKFERGIPFVCASFTDVPVNMDVIKCQGLDIAEVRVDLCKNQDSHAIYEVLRAFRDAGIKTLLTIRSWSHGGRWTRTHEERIDLILRVYDAADIIDIEDDCDVPDTLRNILQTESKPGPLLLVSHHNTKQTPSHSILCDIREGALEKKPHLIKIATHVYSHRDVARLTAFMESYGAEQNLIVIGMGQYGLITRISFPLHGSPITFCYREAPTAPGQLSLDDTVNFLRTFYPQYDEVIKRRLETMKYS